MNRINKELQRFLVAGVSAVGTDLVSYYILLNFLRHDIAKGISFLCGTIVAYIINKYWTFGKYEKSFSEIIKFIILYSCTLGMNVLMNKFVIIISVNKIFLAFIIATIFSAILNFIGQKYWVFKIIGGKI